MVKIAAVVILYYPPSTIIKNIMSYVNEVEELYIMDNSPHANTTITTELSNYNIFYIHDGENKGIAARLNSAAKMAYDKGFQWLLTMDQDSYFTFGAVKKYKAYIHDFNNKETVAAFGASFSNTENTTTIYQEVSLLITSGSIINLNVLNTIGNFDENLFIDEVDSEYCYRSRINQFKLIECATIQLQHQLGENIIARSFKSGKLSTRRLHQPIRIYYIVRNYFYVRKKLPTLSAEEKKQMQHNLWIHLKNNILYNKKRLLVIHYAFKGYIDYKKNKMGKLNR